MSNTNQVECISKPIRTLSLGVGVQTMYLLLKHRERYDYALHCDIANGDRKHGEYEITYWILDNIVKPFCEKEKLPLVILTHKEAGLWERSFKKKMLPMMHPRWCTQDHKIYLMRKYIRTKLKANFPDNVVHSDIGFSYDEIERINNVSDVNSRKYEKLDYPLVDWRITRKQCAEWLNKNYPISIDWNDAKSGCWFCPFWRKQKLLQLSDWQKNEMIMLEENAKLGKGKTWKGIPLKQYLHLDTQKLDAYLDDMGCTSGRCFV